MTSLEHQLDRMTIAQADGARLRHALACSPFLVRMLEADAALLPELMAGLHQPWDADAMQAFISARPMAGEGDLKRVLRQLRRSVMARLIARDLGGLADLDEVMATCTTLAEVAVRTALHHLEGEQIAAYGIPCGQGGARQHLIVVGMGKLGGRELNVSSDIDLIFAYGEDGVTDGARRLDNHDYFARLGKKLIAAIGEPTEDGFVFRVDMRLRPYGESGPLVGSFAMIEEYYQAQGREWERYAWIKGRVVAGPEDEIQALLRPFVYRKYLDYGAFASMRELKAHIMREVQRRDMHDNIKLGPGGIREIEFIAQVFQLIRGGQDQELQVRPTLEVLALLQRKGSLSAEVVDTLRAAYVFLRNLEHRLQYQQDAQTQTLPADELTRARVAQAMDCAGWPALQQALDAHRTRVERHFEAVFSVQEADAPDGSLASLWNGGLEAEEALQRLNEAGYAPADDVLRRLRALRDGGRYRQLSSGARERLDALMPAVLCTAATLENPGATLCRLLDLLESICRRSSYLALLHEYPQALELLVRLAGASPWLAGTLAQHPILLDELLDTRTLYATPDFDALRRELRQRLAEADGDVERQMDLMRHFRHAGVFRFAVQDLAGSLVLETLSDHLSALADLILDATLETVWPGVRGRHRDSPAFAVIGYGKLGGKELGYASDLDIIFLYDDAAPEAGEIYARFGQRINGWLNAATAAGVLYETDLRLRPDGASGLLVSSVDAFAHYQRESAWTWERQALTRARFCAGDPAVGQRFEAIRHSVLCQPRDPESLRAEVLAMRQKMHDGHPNPTTLFDLKHDTGGIVDVEFIVQSLVLAHAARYPQLTANIGNLALLRLAATLGLIKADSAEAAITAYRTYRARQHALRLQGADKARVDAREIATHVAAVTALWRQVFGV